MVKLSNKPNVRGIKSVSEDMKYRTQLIGRASRLNAGLSVTRAKGIFLGIFVVALLVGIPYALMG